MIILEKQPDEKASVYARRVILQNIVELELLPGSSISENELSAQLSLSRTPIREALIEMEKLGLVEIVPQKGSYVTKIEYDRIEDAKFIRLSLETSVVKLACEQGISERHLKKLRENIERQRSYAQHPSSKYNMTDLDNIFHQLLFCAVQKERVYEFLKLQMVHFDRLRNLSYQTLKTAKLERALRDHENILYALERKDSELAGMVMKVHLTRHQIEKKELEEFCPEYFV
ncbi:MAG: GntR family transcriptional regulator [Eubacteriales bacterium]|nr:GntR family transcriptional regulator [Eubacteriales bacterium]